VQLAAIRATPLRPPAVGRRHRAARPRLARDVERRCGLVRHGRGGPRSTVGSVPSWRPVRFRASS